MSTSRYAVFVAYAEADGWWVEGFLLTSLNESAVRYLTERDFKLGAPRIEALERAIEASDRIVLVISQAFIADHSSQLITRIAQHYGVDSETWPVIPLYLESVTNVDPSVAMLTGLDATDSGNWSTVLERLFAELNEPVPSDAPLPRCPYPGMRSFDVTDQSVFYGRRKETRRLIEEYLRLHTFVAIIGASGTGKSSLVFAGLWPALQRSQYFGSPTWVMRSMRPGATPLLTLQQLLGAEVSEAQVAVDACLASALGPDCGEQAKLLIVVDQLEELFTPSLDGAGEEAVEFQSAVLRLANADRCYVVVTARADYYADMMESLLWPQIRSHRLEITSLDRAELSEVILRPAQSVGVQFDPALVERLLAEARGQPGILPFLQETLRLLWGGLKRRCLPSSAYDELTKIAAESVPREFAQRTGLEATIANRADQSIAALTSDKARVVARRILLRLVQFGEGRSHARRQQTVAQLRSTVEEEDVFLATLRDLVDMRLLTVSGDEGAPEDRATVDLAHEALLSGWPTLARWISERQEAEQTRRWLNELARKWRCREDAAGDSGLLDEVELQEADRWRKQHGLDLGIDPGLEEFLTASCEKIADLRQRERDRRNRELEHQRKVTRLTAAALLVALVASVALALLWNEARRQNALARARYLASEAKQAMDDGLWQRGLLLAAESATLATDAQIEETLRFGLERTHGSAAQAHVGGVTAVAVTDGEDVVITGGKDGAIRTWEVSDGLPEYGSTQEIQSGAVVGVVLAPDASQVVAAGSGGRVVRARLADMRLGPVETLWEPTEELLFLEGAKHSVVTGLSDGSVIAWVDAFGATPIPVELSKPDGTLETLAISSDASLVVVGAGNRVYVYKEPFSERSTPAILRCHSVRLLGGGGAAGIEQLTFSDDQKWLYSTGLDGRICGYEVDTIFNEPRLVTLDGSMDKVGHIEATNFRILAASSPIVSFLQDGHPLATFFAPRPAERSVAFTRNKPFASFPIGEDFVTALGRTSDNDLWAVGHESGRITLWDMSPLGSPPSPDEILNGHEGAVRIVYGVGGGKGLLSAGDDGSLRLLTPLARLVAQEPRVLAEGDARAPATVSVSDDRLVVAQSAREVRVWKTSTLYRSDAEPTVFPGGVAAATDAAGRWLVTGSSDGAVGVASSEGGRFGPISNVGSHDVASTSISGTFGVTAVAIAPSASFFLTGGARGDVRLWSLAERPKLVTSFMTHDVRPQPNEISLDLAMGSLRVTTLSVSASAEQAVAGTRSGAVWVWQHPSRDSEPRLLFKGAESVRHAAFAPTAKWLAVASGPSLRLFDFARHAVEAASVLPNEGDHDITAIEFVADDTLIVANDGGIVTIWRAGGKHVGWSQQAELLLDSGVSALAKSGESEMLIGTEGGQIHIWEISEGSENSRPLGSMQSGVKSIAWIESMSLAVSSSEEGAIKVWDRSVESLACMARIRAGRQLTRAESVRFLSSAGAPGNHGVIHDRATSECVEALKKRRSILDAAR